MPKPHDCGGDAAAYVLGALSAEELEAFRTHLESCVVCQHEVRSFQQVGDVLGMAAPQQPVSRELRKRVLKEVRADARARATDAAAGRGGASGRGRAQRLGGVRIASRPALAVLAAVLLAIVVIVGFQLGSGGNATRVFAADVGDARVQVSGDGHAELIVRHLPRPADGRTYEVWLKRGHGGPTPAHVLFEVGSSGARDVGLPGDLKGVSAVMVTEEPAGGTKVPTTEPVIVTPIS